MNPLLEISLVIAIGVTAFLVCTVTGGVIGWYLGRGE